jgi:hypothetical protein
VEDEVGESQHNICVLMSANDHQLKDNKEDAVDNSEALIIPRPHYNVIWDYIKINKVQSKVDDVVRNGGESYRATKALVHLVQWLLWSDVRSCLGIIYKSYTLGYSDLYHRRLSDWTCASIEESCYLISSRRGRILQCKMSANAKRLGLLPHLFAKQSSSLNLFDMKLRVHNRSPWGGGDKSTALASINSNLYSSKRHMSDVG